MALKPWMTSTDLIECVKRKIALPINQRTFSESDILAFANEELMISQVPDIMIYHEEYFVRSDSYPLYPNQKNYPIPERALGLKLRDLFYKDNNGNLFEMTRVSPDDKAYWQRESAATNLMQKYFLEGNDIVLTPQSVQSPTGSLQFSYYLRPNQLVTNDRAAISQNFFSNVVVDNSTIVAGDTFSIGPVDAVITFTAVSGAPSALEFQIGGTSIITATNLVNAINLDNTYNASNGSPASAIVTIDYLVLPLVPVASPGAALNVTMVSDPSQFITTSNVLGFAISNQIGIQFADVLPSNITSGVNIDFIQTKPGHRTLTLSTPLLPAETVSTNSILFNAGVIPNTFIIGDYICQEYECIIPQIPADLHNGLAERVCGRILAAQGDMAGLQMTNEKLAKVQHAEGTLLDNRVDGSTQKITQRKSMVSWLRMGIRRRI